MNAPIASIGVIRSMPCRIPQLSPTHPTKGRANNPGSAHRDPILNPIDLARGGIANESAASNPGPTIATEKLMRALKVMAIQTAGDRASPAASADVRKVLAAKKRTIRAGSLATSLSPIEAPIANPANWAGSTEAAITPRALSSKLKTSS